MAEDVHAEQQGELIPRSCGTYVPTKKAQEQRNNNKHAYAGITDRFLHI
jgi:hypothetical protein